ncbi:type II secretion system protein GspL [uncultured Tateyamaria sp.]|uniref:type II secretion system protein GspL n=1 Tax=uncultured Tateyamaria sp. TaxID=455651 RepID=UPI00261EC375|nr:type II secretion system protein GspL [uncultured Tateyamaria sp.]
MLNQSVSIGDIDRPDTGSTALFPLPSSDFIRAVDPDLKARLIRAAAALALPSPQVIPGAAVLLHAVDLPLSSGRKRRAAAPFAMEPFLAAPLEETHVSVGPVRDETIRICAAISVETLNRHLNSATGSAAILPDLCAVPLPVTKGTWSVWFGQNATYLRTFDGAGCVVAKDGFADLWRAFGRTPIQVCHGIMPPGVDSHGSVSKLEPVPLSVFELDLRPVQRATRDVWRKRVGFAVGLSAVASLAHAAVLLTDARALERLATDRRAALVAAAEGRGAALDFNLPTAVLTSELERRAHPTDTTDPFLRLLALTGIALKRQNSIEFRDLRYDASAGTLTALISASDLAALQIAENALRTNGIVVTGGAATTGPTGAEMQLILSEAG